MITYSSTRGQDLNRSFDHVLLEGLARDGGLFVPDHLPHLSSDIVHSFKDKSYQEVAFAVLNPFLKGWIEEEQLKAMIDKAYASFSHDEITPLYKLNDDTHCLELFHGPTLAFKDVALQLLGYLFEHSLSKKKGEKRTVLGATSGDTGSAAIHGCKGLDHLNIVILHPKGRTSDIQRKQMTTVLDQNVLNIAVEGSFDDCQTMVKETFADEEFRDKFGLTAINSINWARILAQIPYYFYASTRLKQEKKPLKVVVPTGNFGNILAGYYAKKMGAPIDQLIAVTNENDSLYRFFQTNVMQTGTVVQTPSPSMDIQISSNFERFLFEMLDRDSSSVVAHMAALKNEGLYTVDMGRKQPFDSMMKAYRCSNEETRHIIKSSFETEGYVLDPHSATAIYGVYQEKKERLEPATYIALCCAHPAKFPDVVEAEIGSGVEQPDFIKNLDQLEERVETLGADVSQLKSMIQTNFT